MKRIGFLCALTALWAILATGAEAAPTRPELGGTGCSNPATVSDLGDFEKDGALCQVQDGQDSSDCSVGNGSSVVLCCYDGSSWSACGGAGGGGSGDVTGVGDCSDGACLDGTSDGGTYIRLYDGNSHYTALIPSDSSSNLTITFPNESGTVCTDSSVCSNYSDATHTHIMGLDNDGLPLDQSFWFTSTADSNALVFEGVTSDTSEGTLVGADFSADRTITIPDQSGTLCVNDSSTSGCGNIANTTATTDAAITAWVGTAGKTVENTECIMSDIDGDGSNDYINCPEGFIAGDQGCANNTDCNFVAIAKNSASTGTPTCTTMVAGDSNLLGKMFFLPKSDDSVVLCDESTELGDIVAAAAADITDVGDCSTADCFTADGTGNSIYFEGTSPDGWETILTAADTTASDKTITLPNETGTVCTTGSICSGTVTYQAYIAGASDITTENVFAANEAAGGFDLTNTQTECVTLMASGIVCLGAGGCTDPVDIDGTNFSYRGAAFATDADDIGTFTFKTPLNMSGTTAAVKFAWISNDGACNDGADDDVCWTVDGDSFANEVQFNGGSLAGTEVGTSDRCKASGSVMVSAAVTFTHSMSPDETAVLNIRRDTDETVGSCSDDYGQNANLLWVEFCYEVDNLNSGEN